MNQWRPDKNTKILIVDPVKGMISTLKRALQDLGFQKIQVAENVMDALSTIDNEGVDWIISALYSQERFHVGHFLRLALEFSGLEHVHTSVLYASDEIAQLPTLFGAGLLSAHSRNLPYNGLIESFRALLLKVERLPSLAHVVTLELRKILFELKAFDDLEALERSFYEHHDKSLHQRLNLVHSQLALGKKLESMHALKDIADQEPKLLEEVNRLSLSYLKIPNIHEWQGSLPIRRAVVLDVDRAQSNFVKMCLEEMGADTIDIFEAPQEALQYLENQDDIDIFVSEWKLSYTNAQALVQIAKHGPLREKPIVLYTSQLTDNELKLVQELGGIFHLSKPRAKSQFKKDTYQLLSRWRFPVAGEDLEAQIKLKLQAKDFPAANQLLKQLETSIKLDPRRKLILLAQFAYHQEQYLEARRLILEAAQIKLPQHQELGLLGKVLLKLGAFAEALKCFEQAHHMVPGNIERICSMADASAGLKDFVRRRELLEEARTLAPESNLVRETITRHALEDSQSASNGRLIEEEGMARLMVAHMNNLGVTYARTGHWEKSFEMYQEALKALQSFHPELKASVYFNLGLYHLRRQHLQNALEPLQKAGKAKDNILSTKASELIKKVKHAIKTNTPLVFREDGKQEKYELTAKHAKLTPSPYASLVATGQGADYGVIGLFWPQMPCPVDLSIEYPGFFLKSKRWPWKGKTLKTS